MEFFRGYVHSGAVRSMSEAPACSSLMFLLLRTLPSLTSPKLPLNSTEPEKTIGSSTCELEYMPAPVPPALSVLSLLMKDAAPLNCT